MARVETCDIIVAEKDVSRRHARVERTPDGGLRIVDLESAGGVWIGGEQSTITALLARRLEADPDREYLDVCGTKLTAADVASVGARLANALIDFGVKPGDRVATLIENSAEATLAWWGTIRAGAISVPINTAYKGEYLRHQLADSGAKALVRGVRTPFSEERNARKSAGLSRRISPL